MLSKLKVLNHASVYIDDEIVIYVDPFNIKKEKDADYIFITHDHYDHLSVEDCKKIMKEDTVVVGCEAIKDKLDVFEKKIIVKDFNVWQKTKCDNLEFMIVPAYNFYPEKLQYHNKEKGYCGYVVKLNGISYYIAGDTDDCDELKSLECDVAIVPVSGKYTMDVEQAANFINQIKPKYAVPYHYGEVIGSREDAERFCKLVDKGIKAEIIL